MKVYLTNSNQCFDIELREWNGSGYQPDCLLDLDDSLHGKPYNEEYEAYEMTQLEFNSLVDYWNGRIDEWSKGYDSEMGTEFTDKQEWTLFVNEV